MYKCEMDPSRTVGATELTWDMGRTEGQADGRMDKPTEWNQYTPHNFVVWGYNDMLYHSYKWIIINLYLSFDEKLCTLCSF